MSAFDNVVKIVEENPLLVIGGTLGAVILFSLVGRGGGGGDVVRVLPEHTLQSQKIAADTNVALAGVQAQREQAFVGLAEVAAARDVGLYQSAVQASLGKSATDAAIAGAAYQLAGQSVQAKTAIAINEIQADVVNNQTRAQLASNLAGITAGYVGARDQLQVQSKALDVQRDIVFEQEKTLQNRDVIQYHSQMASDYIGRSVAFKALDAQNLSNERMFQTELAALQFTPQLLDNQYRLAHLQATTQQYSVGVQAETAQYIAKKATKGGILNNLISGAFGTANNLIGVAAR